MKNQCRQESEDSELDFVMTRPVVSMDATVCNFPAVKRPLHSDNILNAFEVSEVASRGSVIVLEKNLSGAGNLEPYRKWVSQHSQYVASHVKHDVAELDGRQYIASYLQLIGQVSLNIPGKLRDVNDDWLLSSLQRAHNIKQESLEIGLIPSFTPSLTASCRLFGEFCVAPFGLMNADWSKKEGALVRNASSVATYLKLLYWLIAGINLFDENAESPSLLSKWSPLISLRSAEIFRASLSRPPDEVDFLHVLGELRNEIGGGAAPAKRDDETKPAVKAGLERVAAMRQIKHVLQREVIASVRDPASFASYGLTSVSSILFFGPSGCGKTHLAKCLAEELGLLAIQIRPSDIASMYVRETVMRIRECFDEAVKNIPCVLFFDEFDALVPDRHKLERSQDYRVEEVNEILTQLDLAREKGVFVVAATNQPFNMDRGIFQAGRFDKIIYIGPPEEDDRAELLEHFMHGRPAVADLDLQSFSSRLDGFSIADVRAVVEEAARLALFLGKAPISQSILGEALNRTPPSISREAERRFEKFIGQGYSG